MKVVAINTWYRTEYCRGKFGVGASASAGSLVFQCHEWVDARSVLSLLSLAAGPGVVLGLRAVGADAEEAVASLGRLIEEPTGPG